MAGRQLGLGHFKQRRSLPVASCDPGGLIENARTDVRDDDQGAATTTLRGAVRA